MCVCVLLPVLTTELKDLFVFTGPPCIFEYAHPLKESVYESLLSHPNVSCEQQKKREEIFLERTAKEERQSKMRRFARKFFLAQPTAVIGRKTPMFNKVLASPMRSTSHNASRASGSAESPHVPGVGTQPQIPSYLTISKDQAALLRMIGPYLPEKLVKEIKKAVTWEEQAKLGLVALAAEYCGHGIPSTVRELLDATCKLESNGYPNSVLLLLAAQQGIFSVGSYTCVCPQSLDDLVEKGTLIDGKRVLELEREYIINRHVHRRLVDSSALIDYERSYIDEESKEKRSQLTIVTGESGSGKTVSAIASVVLRRDTLCLYHIIPLSLNDDIVKLDQHNRPTFIKNRNDKVSEYLKNLLKAQLVTVPSQKAAVLILDEMGMSPMVVRALCSIYSGILPQLQEIVKVRAFHLIVAGTGIESDDLLPGSAVHTYNVVRMTDVTGQEFLDKLRESFPQQLQDLIREDSPYAIGQEAWRVLSNRRVAAAFAQKVEGDKSGAVSMDWRQSLSTYLNTALIKAKGLNGFQKFTHEECMEHFADALAYSFGGKDQKVTPADYKTLMVECGILVDNCELVKDGTRLPDDTERVAAQSTGGDSTDLGSGVLVLDMGKYKGHRYSVSVAMLENGLRGFGLVQRDHTGLAFEDTIRDFLMVQMLAGSSGRRVKIKDPPKDVLSEVKEVVRAASIDVSLIVSVVLSEPALSVDAAIESATPAILAEMKRLESPSATTVGVIIKNSPLASAADVFAAVVSIVNGRIDSDSNGLKLSLQMKRYEAGQLTNFYLAAELYKMGDRGIASVAGHVANTVLKPKDLPQHIKTASALKCPDAKKALNLARGCFKTKNVNRQELFDQLKVVLGAVIHSDQQKGNRHYFVIAAVGADPAKKLKSLGPSVIAATIGELSDAMYPVYLSRKPKGQAGGVVLESTVAMRCRPRKDKPRTQSPALPTSQVK